jgi:hypothetical protein
MYHSIFFLLGWAPRTFSHRVTSVHSNSQELLSGCCKSRQMNSRTWLPCHGRDSDAREVQIGRVALLKSGFLSDTRGRANHRVSKVLEVSINMFHDMFVYPGTVSTLFKSLFLN